MHRYRKQGSWKKVMLLGFTLSLLFAAIPIIQAHHYSLNILNQTQDVVIDDSKFSQPLSELVASSENSETPINVIASLSGDTDWRAAQRAILQTATKTNIRIYHSIIHAISLQTTVGSLNQLAGLPEIHKLWTDIGFQITFEEWPYVKTGTPIPPNEYHHPSDIISALPLYELGLNGAHTVVSILDTGIDVTHPDLDDMDDNETTSDPKVLAQVSFAEGDPFPFDLNGHGTYCAGLVAGTGATSNGTYSGIAPGANLMSAKVLLGDGTGYSSWVIRGIEWSIQNGADIILLPFSTFGVPGDPLSEAVRLAAEQGVLVIAAAGDRGPNHVTIMSPGESFAALTIGAYDEEKAMVAEFSSRGPTFDMRTKPDLIAPGVDIISTSLYNIIPTEIGNISIPISIEDINLDLLGLSRFGIPINENYTLASTTAASAAIAAGASCLLLEGSRYATPECLSIGMRRGATPLANQPNSEGSGLLNATKAFFEISILHNPFPTNFRSRSVSFGLPYYGMLMSETTTENVTLLMSGYSTAIAAIATSSVTNMTLLHMLMGMFYIGIGDNNPIPFALLDVEQEFHWTGLPFGNYIRATGILSHNDLLIVPRIESWQITSAPLANAFRISFFILNIGAEDFTNIRIYSLWNFELFTGANDTSIQQGFFNSTSQLFHIHADVLPPNETTRVDQYIGIYGSTAFSSFEVGFYEDVSKRLQNDTLNGNSSHANENGVGFGTKWSVGNVASNSNAVNVSMTLGFGRNFTALAHAINETKYASIPNPQADLCMIRVRLPRIGVTNTTYLTSTIALNIGDIGVDSIAAFFTNRSQPMGGAVYARYFQLSHFAPFQFQELEVEWNPEKTDIYFVAWIVSPNIGFDLFIPSIPEDRYPLDNLAYRDVFISTPPMMRMLIPTFLPFQPMTIRFPNDFAIYNFTLITSTPIEHLYVSITEYYDVNLNSPINRNITRWANPPIVSPTHIFGFKIGTQFQLFIAIPPFIESGPYYGNLIIRTSDAWQTTIPLVINITYPRAVVLFDSIHNLGIDFGHLEELDFTELSLSELFSLFDEFGDSLFTGYSRIRELFAEAQINLAESPLISELNSTVLSLFDGVIICDPEKGFTVDETRALLEFIESGYKVLILADKPSSSNHTALNQLLANYNIQLGGTVTTTNSTELLSSSPFTDGVNIITTDDGTILQLTGTAQIFAWVNGSAFGLYHNQDQKELFVLGCSSIFSNAQLYKVDNKIFANQTLRYLFRKTVTLSIRPTGGIGANFYIGNDAGFVIDAVNQTGHGVENLTMYVIYRYPNGTQSFFIAFEVKDGRYGTFLFANWTGLDSTINTSQTFTIIILTTPGVYASTANYIYFYYIPAPPSPPPPPEPDFLAIMELQIVIATVATILIIGVYFLNQHRRRRRMRTPPLSEEIIQNIDNTLNTTQALIREMEWTLTDRRIDRIEKLRITSGEPANRLENMLKRLRELAKETGV